jgi:hypothetical protein
MKTIILAVLLSQTVGQAKIVKKEVPHKSGECNITEAAKVECAKFDRFPTCVKLGNDWTYRCDKRYK